MFCKSKKFCLFILHILFTICLLGLPNLLMANELEANINALTKNLPPLSVQSSQDIRNISPYLRYAHGLEVSDAKSVYAQREKFIPYNNSEAHPPLGAYWFLLSFSPIKDASVSAAFLDIGDNLPKNSKIMILPRRAKEWQLIEDVYTRQKFHQEIVEDTELKKIESNINLFSSGLYDLTPLRQGGELLIYSPGLPGLWFSPSLVKPASAPITLERQITPILLLSLFALMFFSLWRGMREEGDARLWAATLTFCALVQYSFGVVENPEGKVEIWSLVGIVCASLSIFLLPHIGRHYMVTEKNSPNMDGFFQFLAIPAIFPLAVFFTPLPQYYSILYYAPLWGLYAFLPCFFTVIPALIGRKGAKFYFFFSLCIGLGALTGLVFRENPIFSLAPQAGLCVAMFAMFLAPRQNEKNIIEKKEDEHADPIRDFAEHNMFVREVFFRVEAKLREPFDRIMREACYLDVGTKSDEISDAIKILQEQNDEQAKGFSRQAVQNISDKTNKLQTHTDALVHACKDLSGLLRNMPKLAQKATPYQSSHELFNLKNLVLHACDAIRQEAQDKQIGLGWYIAPQMGLFYRGDKNKLNEVLGLLLRDAVRATQKGMISVRVRRANNPNPGHIVFTISDSGKGRPPVERSPLTLIKAWELSTQHNGEVELHSSPNGLSFSFSLECIAMDASGAKPVAFANLDEIVVRKKHGVQTDKTPQEGTSGGNLVFTRTQENMIVTEDQQKEDAKGISQKQLNNTNTSDKNAVNTVDKVLEDTRQETSKSVLDKANITAQKSKDSLLEPSFTDCQDTEKKENILLICPPAIQRQNIAWYINQYEIWEALDVDSALACYETKPSKLVLVHSSLSANGCSAVIAGIRLLENSLGLSHTTFLGLYQSAKDMEFLRLAGCKHVLPGNIGREGLGMTVAEILQDPFLAPIEDIETGHLVLKKDVQLAQKIQEEAKLAVEKCLNTKREFAGTVDDTAPLAFDSQDSETKSSQSSTEQKVQTKPESQNSTSEENTTVSTETLSPVSDEETPFLEETPSLEESTQESETKQSSNSDLNLNMTTVSNNRTNKSKTAYPINPIDEEEFIQSEEQVLAREKAKEEASKLEHVGTVDDTLPQAHFYTQAQQNAKKGLLSTIFGFMKPKPSTSLHTEDSYIDDLVGEPTPIITNALKAQAHLQKTIIEEEIEEQNLEELYSDSFETNADTEFVGEPSDVSTVTIENAFPTTASPENTVAHLSSNFASNFAKDFEDENVAEKVDTEEVITESKEVGTSTTTNITDTIDIIAESEIEAKTDLTEEAETTEATEVVGEVINADEMTQAMTDENTEETQVTAQTENEEIQQKKESIEDTDSITDEVNITDEDSAETDTVFIDEDCTGTEAIPISEIDNQSFTSEEPVNIDSEDNILAEEDSNNKENQESDDKELPRMESDDLEIPTNEPDDSELSTEEPTEKPSEEPTEKPSEEPCHEDSEIQAINDENDEIEMDSNEDNNTFDENSLEGTIELTEILAPTEVEPSHTSEETNPSDIDEKENDTFLENISRHLTALSHEEKEGKREITENPLQDLLPFSSKFVTQQGYFKEDDLPKSLFVPKNENNLIKHDFSDDFLSFDPEIQTDIKGEDKKDEESMRSEDLAEQEIMTIKNMEQTEHSISPAQDIDQDEADLFESANSEVMQLTEDMLLPQQNIKTDNKAIELELDLTPQNGGKHQKTNSSKLELLWDSPENQETPKESNQITEKNDTLSFFPENKD